MWTLGGDIMSMCDYCIKIGDCNQPKWHTKMVINGDMYCDHIKFIQMPRISMNSATSAFVSRNKSVTRRNWAQSTVKRFPKGKQFLAVMSNYGGDVLGIGEVTKNPFKQNTRDMNITSEYIAEGFEYLDGKYESIVDDIDSLANTIEDWADKNRILTVIPFKVIEIFPGMLERYTTDSEIIRCVKALRKAIG